MEDFFAGGRVTKRAAFFSGMANRLSESVPELESEVYFVPEAPVVLAHCYFLLSDAYKDFRNRPESLTDDYKKAALSAVAVMVVRPFVPLDTDNVRSLKAYLSSAMYALACGNAWAADRNLFEHYPFDYLKRFYSTLNNTRIEALDEFQSLLRDHASISHITRISLSKRDMATLDDWVLKFFMLCNQRR